jgi:hypothetical protein
VIQDGWVQTIPLRELLVKGWQSDERGHLVLGELTVPRNLVPYLGQEREVEQVLNTTRWLDLKTGYVWPGQVLKHNTSLLCECGARHSSLPDHHSMWCPLYK